MTKALSPEKKVNKPSAYLTTPIPPVRREGNPPPPVHREGNPPPPVHREENKVDPKNLLSLEELKNKLQKIDGDDFWDIFDDDFWIRLYQLGNYNVKALISETLNEIEEDKKCIVCGEMVYPPENYFEACRFPHKYKPVIDWENEDYWADTDPSCHDTSFSQNKAGYIYPCCRQKGTAKYCTGFHKFAENTTDNTGKMNQKPKVVDLT